MFLIQKNGPVLKARRRVVSSIASGILLVFGGQRRYIPDLYAYGTLNPHLVRLIPFPYRLPLSGVHTSLAMGRFLVFPGPN